MRAPELRVHLDGLVVDSFAGGQCVGPRPKPLGTCAECAVSFIRDVRNKRYCGSPCRLAAHAKRHNLPPHRTCRQCGSGFHRQGRGQSNKWYCSAECARLGARRARAEFSKKRPERDAIYRDRQRAKKRRDTALERLWRKYPWMPRACEACGESRVLDLAHRPEHARRGAWKTMSNTTPEKIWVLCPRCHALLDRLGFTEAQLGIVPRSSEAA